MKRKIRGVSVYSAEKEFTREGRALAGLPDGRWVLGRALGYDTLRWRLRCAIRVFRGDADILVWEQDEVRP